MQPPSAETAGPVERLVTQLDRAVQRLAQTRPFAKETARRQVLDLLRRLLAAEGGVAPVRQRVAEIEAAGFFQGTDWDHPEILQPLLVQHTLHSGDTLSIVLECTSQLRLLAVARNEFFHPRIASEQAHHFLSQVLALNLQMLFDRGTEQARNQVMGAAIRNVLQDVVEGIGFGNILEGLIEEIWRILAQRPIMLNDVKGMVTQIALCLHDPDIDVGGTNLGADRLISALYGPTAATREDPGLAVYRERLTAMDDNALEQEAGAFGRAMHDSGLVSPYHAVFLRFVNDRRDHLPAQALGLSSTGQDALLCYRQLAQTLIHQAVHPQTCQCIYGLALMLERGILYMPSLAPALWRQIGLSLCPEAEEVIARTFGRELPPAIFLLSGVISLLGQPLGVGQGNNPTCQSARAISMWAYTDPDYLLQVLTWAARDNEVIMHFEGQEISSTALQAGLAQSPPMDVDPLSVVLVPHLDRIYLEMGRHCVGRPQDPHQWVNPELHGWWVGRGFAIAVDVASGALDDYPGFIRAFYAAYHPYYNGNQPVIHPQPAGLAITDSAARFVGWHAIAIYRVGLDQNNKMRVYFYNPNNDSGQNWGDGVVVATEGSAERYGESSLPVDQFASRLYLFHFDPLERGYPEAVPTEEVERAAATGRKSWAAGRHENPPPDAA